MGPTESCDARGMWTDQRGSELLPLAECVRLLATAAKRDLTGRLAISTPQAPIIQPVNFCYRDHNILIRLGSGHMADNISGALVAFEVDHVDLAPTRLSVLSGPGDTTLEDQRPERLPKWPRHLSCPRPATRSSSSA